MMTGSPLTSQIKCNTVSATGTLVTVPAGFKYTGSLTMSATVSGVGASTPTVSVNGNLSVPASGTVIGRINLAGLAGSTISQSAYFEVLCEAPATNDITIEFTAGANGTSSATLNGYVFG